jgi:hypothetical protein
MPSATGARQQGSFGFRRKEAARLCKLLDQAGGGLITLNELLEGAPRFLKEICRNAFPGAGGFWEEAR